MTQFPEFAYSPSMQLILFFISAINTLINYYFITNLITEIYGQEVSKKRKLLFAAILSLALNQFWVYGIFALGHFQSFSPLVYVFIVSPNPLFALLYYWVGIKVLNLSKYRSVRLMRMVYLYVICLRCLGEFVGTFMVSTYNTTPERYNFLLDAVSSFTYTSIYYLIYVAISYMIKKSSFQIQLLDCLPVKNLKYELFISFVHASTIYFICALLPLYFESQSMKIIGYVLTGIILTCILAINTLLHYINTLNQGIENKDINMRVLMNALDDFSGLKHDFFNILQTYEGYIAVRDLSRLKKYHKTLLSTTTVESKKLDFANQMIQNPDFMSMLMLKEQHAEKEGCSLNIRIMCGIDDLYIPSEPISRCVSLLIDLLISCQGREKNTFLSIEQKNPNTKLIIINNRTLNHNDSKSMSKFDIQPNSPILREVRRILYKYNNAFFHVVLNNRDFFAYIEIQQF